MVQWLRHHASNAGGMGLILDQGTKIPQAPQHGQKKKRRKGMARGFLGGLVIKNLPANSGDMGSIPGPGRSHMPWSN